MNPVKVVRGFLRPSVCDPRYLKPVLLREGRPVQLNQVALNAIRTNRALRIVAVIATLMGWFVLSNHCALGGIGSRVGAKRPHECCHSDTSQPAKEPTDHEGMMGCCKSLHALAPDGAKLTDVPPAFVAGAIVAFGLTRDAQPQAEVVPFGDTGPPRVASFSELVLHRSLRSHAPPFFA